MNTVWMVEIEDEHGMAGMTNSCACASRESALFWLWIHLKDQSVLKNERWYSRVFLTFDNIEKDIVEFERLMQGYYGGWEYGGRFCISVHEQRIYDSVFVPEEDFSTSQNTEV